MSISQTPVPRFSEPPGEYSQRYMGDLVRALNQFARIVSNPGQGRNTFLVLTDLHSDDVGLEPGSLYKDGTYVKISTLDVAALRGASLTVSLGTVTVTVT